MRTRQVFCSLAAILAACCHLAAAQAASQDPQEATRKLGVFLGKWQTEGTINGEKVTSDLECRWSPKNNFLVCEQLVSRAGQQNRQLTIYAHHPKEGNYTFSTFSNPGDKPSSGSLTVSGNIWTYSFSFQAGDKTTMIRTLNEFPAPGAENFKTEVSTDGGAHWSVVLQGTGHRIAD